MNTILNDTSPFQLGLITLISATVFTIIWALDSKTHGKLVKIDVTDKELQTHRNILVASFLMEFSLVLMYWNQWLALTLFIASFVTRIVHEFIDELHFHTDRCSIYESRLHLGMWISILTKTSAMFIWGFFMQYDGILELPIFMYLWAVIIFLTMSYISLIEWKR